MIQSDDGLIKCYCDNLIKYINSILSKFATLEYFITFRPLQI